MYTLKWRKNIMENVRIGIIGIGNMGIEHAQNLFNGKVPGGTLSAICDNNPERLKWARQTFGDKVHLFDNQDALFAAKAVDAILIVTPHYDHPRLAIKGFENGLHVLTEKPVGVYTKAVREMNAVALKSDRVFGIMYNQRTNPLYQKLKDLIDSGELGEIRRTNWIITNWYRSQSYYDSGKWRATWANEGGGILLNQDQHQLDLWQWTCGMPKRVRTFCGFGKRRNIEAEDAATAYVEYENGATGVFITSVTEAPGTNRLEVSGDNGKIVIENEQLTFWRNRVPESKFNAEFTGGFGKPECWKCEIPILGENTGRIGILKNWVEAILKGTKLLAPGIEGIRALTISNAMYLSDWTDSWVDTPINENLFYEMLQERIKKSTFKKDVVENRKA
jgi:predicted dehydrogenase